MNIAKNPTDVHWSDLLPKDPADWNMGHCPNWMATSAWLQVLRGAEQRRSGWLLVELHREKVLLERFGDILGQMIFTAKRNAERSQEEGGRNCLRYPSREYRVEPRYDDDSSPVGMGDITPIGSDASALTRRG